MRRFAGIVFLVLAVDAPAVGQTTPPSAAPPNEGLIFSASLRARFEAWDWFDAGGNANDDYAFSGSLVRVGFRQTTTRLAWQIELGVPVLIGLPADAIGAGAQGQLGFGASYFVANDNRRNAASLFVKQASVRVNNLAGIGGQSLTAGRMDIVDGTEVTPKDATLAALKRDRIAHRLIGNFVFTHVGRSIDGVQYVVDKPAWNVTAVGGRPTQGVFQVDGWGEVDVTLVYGALTHQIAQTGRAAEWRAFVIGYDDRRAAVVKTDNRALPIRRADTGHIDVTTIGGHFVEAIPTSAGPVDVLLWGAAQTGSWGALTHDAAAFAAEAGWQPSGAPRLRPWIRGGYDFGSGDSDPDDARHGTFFQVLPTPRVYARFPFFNMMNMGDGFAELVLRPTPRLTVRADAHALKLVEADDLWYSGGGAFQPDSFGYTGRPSNGERDLATLIDASADFSLNPRATISGYLAHARGGGVVKAIYPAGATARFGYVELTLRF